MSRKLAVSTNKLFLSIYTKEKKKKNPHEDKGENGYGI
jgi:hypothetical protein